MTEHVIMDTRMKVNYLNSDSHSAAVDTVTTHSNYLSMAFSFCILFDE